MNDRRQMPTPEFLLRTPQGIYVVENDTHLSRWVEEHKRLDVAEGQIAFYKDLIPVGGVVIDAGASIGDCTLTYAKLVGPSGHVFAYEPHPLSFQALALNFSPWKNVHTYNLGLSDVIGDTFLAPDENIGASYISTVLGGVPIDVVTLDTHLQPLLDRCDLIHLDVEGFERAVLAGANNIIQRFRPALVLEVNHACLQRYGSSEQHLRDYLAIIGYSMQELEPHLNPSYPQRDILALPNEHPKRIP